MGINDLHLPFMQGKSLGVVRQEWWDALQEPKYQRKLVLVTVSIALLLDNMLYMVIVPIIPDYLRQIGAWETHRVDSLGNTIKPGQAAEQTLIKKYHNDSGWYQTVITNKTTRINVNGILIEYEGEDSGIGMLFASKAAVQIFINPISGHIIDKIGYDLPMMFGITVMFFSTLMFACGSSYGVLFFARSLQGVGSAFADTGGLSMIADRYTEEEERTKALGIALAFISFGCLVAPPFGGILYEFFGKAVPFVILAGVCLIDGFLLILIMRPMKHKEKEDGKEKPVSTPIWKLLIDPHIACCAGALVVANICLAFLEPTISKWMHETMDAEEWQQGMIWLPAFIPHVLGVVVTVKCAKSYPQYQWALALIGLTLEGVACFFIPFSGNFFVLMLPICVICFGIALIDTALLPMLGQIVDKKYTAVYGSVYAIADISYCAAYAFGPVVAGHIVENWGFTTLNIIVGIISLIYAPIIFYLKDFSKCDSSKSGPGFNKYEQSGGYEEAVMMGDPPAKEYNTYVMQDGKPQNGAAPHYAQVPVAETDIIAQSQAEWGEEPTANPFRAAPKSNPFRS